MASTKKPRVLVFIDWFLPGDKAGGPVRSCANLIDHLGKEVEFSVVTRDTDYMESQPYSTVKSDAWNQLPDGKRVYYISESQLTRDAIARLLKEETYDAVYLNGIWSQPFTAWPLRALRKMKSKARVVVAARGMLASSAMAIKATKKKIFLRYAKALRLFSDVIFHATTEQEAADVKRVFGNDAKILIAGNLPRKTAKEIQPRSRQKGALRIVSIARIAPEKNTLYALEALSKVNVPVKVSFFGTIYNEEYFDQCCKLQATLPENVNAVFEDAIDSTAAMNVLQEYDLFFMPTRGENFGHAILEAMQSGLPVLISDQTPWKDLATHKAGWELPLDDANAFAKKIEETAAMNDTVYREWSAGALKFAEKYATDEKLLEDSRKLFRK